MILAPNTSLTGIRFVRTDGSYVVYRELSVCRFIHRGLSSKLPELGPTMLVEWNEE
jgi:hypothetical protein